MLTFGQLMEEIAPSIGSGYDANSITARKYVTRAIQRIYSASPIILERKVLLAAYGDMLVLPDEIRRIKKYWLGGRTLVPQGSIFEFMEAGPGLSGALEQDSSTLIDMNYSPVVYQPPAFLKLELLTDRDEPDCQIIIRGLDASGNEVRSANGTAGETIQLKTANELVESRQSFKKITSIMKTSTRGYVHVYAVDPTDGAKYYLAKLSPSVRNSAFRTYRIPGYNFDSATDEPVLTEVSALVLMKTPASFQNDDIVLIDDVAAVEAVARSMDTLGKGKYQEAQIEAQAGMAMAKESIANEFPGRGMPDIDCKNFMMGDVETL